MELVEFHVLQREPMTPENRIAVPRQRRRIAGYLPDTAISSGGKEHRLGMKKMQFARRDLERHQTARLAIDLNQVEQLELVEKGDIVLQALLIQSLQNHVAGPIGCMARPAHRLSGLVVGVAAERPLRYLAFRGAVEGQAHVLQFDHCFDGLPAEDIDCVLIRQIV